MQLNSYKVELRDHGDQPQRPGGKLQKLGLTARVRGAPPADNESDVRRGADTLPAYGRATRPQFFMVLCIHGIGVGCLEPQT